MTAPEIVVVACGAAKRSGRHRARDLYTGSYFRAALGLADALRRPTFIISAKYGLVRTTDLLDCYDVSMGDAGAVTIEVVRSQARDFGVADCGRVMVLGGKRYVSFLSEIWPDVWNPAGGPNQGIGRQIATYRRLASAYV